MRLCKLFFYIQLHMCSMYIIDYFFLLSIFYYRWEKFIYKCHTWQYRNWKNVFPMRIIIIINAMLNWAYINRVQISSSMTCLAKKKGTSHKKKKRARTLPERTAYRTNTIPDNNKIDATTQIVINIYDSLNGSLSCNFINHFDAFVYNIIQKHLKKFNVSLVDKYYKFQF